MKKTLIAGAITILSLTSVVYAQSTTTPSTSTTTPAEKIAPPTAESVPTTGSITTTTTTTSGPAVMITRQEMNQTTASKIIGAPVYGTGDVKIGSVDDVLLDQSGKVAGIVVGVGGFLGMGEKKVAISYSSLNMTKEDKGVPHISVNVTKEALKASADFVPATRS